MRFKFNVKQLDRISEILGNLGLVFLGSIIAPIFSGNNPNILLVLTALVLAGGCFTLSIRLLRQRK